MGPRCSKMRSGLTLIEIMVAVLVIVVGVLGAMMYRYHTALNARKADVHVNAGRTALLFLEGWKGQGGTLDASDDIIYVPSNDIGINTTYLTDDSYIEITSNGGDNYTVQLTGGTTTYYYLQLTYDEDIDGDSTADAGMRKLSVTATYYGTGSPTSNTLPSKTVTVSGFVRT